MKTSSITTTTEHYYRDSLGSDHSYRTQQQSPYSNRGVSPYSGGTGVGAGATTGQQSPAPARGVSPRTVQTIKWGGQQVISFAFSKKIRGPTPRMPKFERKTI